MESVKIDYTFEEVWRNIVRHEVEWLSPDSVEIDYWRSFAADLKGYSTYEDIVEGGLWAAFYAVISAKVTGHMKSSNKEAFHDMGKLVSKYLRPKTIQLTPEIADEFIEVIHTLTENKIKEVNDFFNVFKPVLKDCENALNMFKAEYASSHSQEHKECSPIKDKGVFVDRVRPSKAVHPAHELCELTGLETEYLLMFDDGYSLGSYSYLEENILDFSKFECVRKPVSDYAEKVIIDEDLDEEELDQYATDSRKEGSDLFLDRYNLIPYLSLKDTGDKVQLSFGINQGDFDISAVFDFNKKSFYDGKLKLEKGNATGVFQKESISSIMGCMVYAVNAFSKKHPGVPIDEVVILPFASENTCGLGQCSLLLSDEDGSVTASSKYKKNHCRVVVAIQ